MLRRFRTTVAGRPSAAAFDFYDIYDQAKRFREFWEGRIEVGKTPRCSLPPVPQGSAKAVPKRFAVLYGEVRHRKAQLRSGSAWPVAPPESRGLWSAIARKAKGQAHLRIARKAIPQLL